MTPFTNSITPRRATSIDKTVTQNDVYVRVQANAQLPTTRKPASIYVNFTFPASELDSTEFKTQVQFHNSAVATPTVSIKYTGEQFQHELYAKNGNVPHPAKEAFIRFMTIYAVPLQNQAQVLAESQLSAKRKETFLKYLAIPSATFDTSYQ